MGWVVSTTPRPLYPRERLGTHCTEGWVGPRAGLDRRLGGPQGRSVQKAGWAPGPVWTCAKNFAPAGIFFWDFFYSRISYIRSPDRPARSQSLYQLSYPAHTTTTAATTTTTTNNNNNNRSPLDMPMQSNRGGGDGIDLTHSQHRR
jgi:hypothetical protein